MTVYPRPVPLVGDTTSAEDRRARPDAWAFDDGDIEIVDQVITLRRDIRRFRPDDVNDTMVRRLLEAAHAAPSVGHSQPWRFVVVRDQSTRVDAALIADRCRIDQAARLDPEAGRQLLALQLDGLREAPVGIVIGCDRRAAPEGVLGRATMHDADMWSCACAIQNIWLAARARGLGVGWVTLFDPNDLARLVGFPDGIVPLGWLCVGYPDERPPLPGLERRGWSKRQSIDEVIAIERWSDDGKAAPPVSRLLGSQPSSRVSATLVRDRHDSVLSPPDGLGVLGQQLDRIERVLVASSGPTGGAVVVSVGDHLVADLGVSAYGREVTGHLLEATRSGESLGARTAQQCGLDFRWFDAGCASGDLVHDDAMSRVEVDRLLSDGRSLGAALADTGLVAIGEAGIGNTTVASALAAHLLGIAPRDAVGLGAGSDSAIVDVKRSVVEQALRRVGRRDAIGVLAGLGGPEIAHLAGVVLGVVGAGGVVVLDGFVTSVAALVADRMSPGIADHLVAGQQSNELAHAAVLGTLGLEPVLHLRLRAGEGIGAAMATRLLLGGLAIRAAAPRTSGSSINSV